MTYYTDLFSPETREVFLNTDRTRTGFRVSQRAAAERVQEGDIFACYVTRLGRWWGLLEVIDEHPYHGEGPLLGEDEANPFVIRFHVRPVVVMENIEHAIPIRDPEVWDGLSFTQGKDRKEPSWTGSLRRSVVPLSPADGELISAVLQRQDREPRMYPLDDEDQRRLARLHVRRVESDVPVSVPEPQEEADDRAESEDHVRTSHQVQATLARLGDDLGLSVWAPRGDRERMLAMIEPRSIPFLERLPLNSDETTRRTIENIDVLWLRGRSIVRAFEVEHTTSVYSGILRMADLLALQPNMDIKLHLVAPSERRDRVFRELRRPVFTLLERGPLSQLCTYLSYDSLDELAVLDNLRHMRDSVIDEYAEEPTDF